MRVAAVCVHTNDGRVVRLETLAAEGFHEPTWSAPAISSPNSIDTDETRSPAISKAGDASIAYRRRLSREIGRSVRNGGTHEYEMQRWIMEAFGREGLKTDDPPIVGVNAHSGDRIMSRVPKLPTDSRRRLGVADIWGKMNRRTRCTNITWTGFVGLAPSGVIGKSSRSSPARADAAAAKVISTVGAGKQIAGWEVDRASRDFITQGFGEYFIHRTGHFDQFRHPLERQPTWTISRCTTCARSFPIAASPSNRA